MITKSGAINFDQVADKSFVLRLSVGKVDVFVSILEAEWRDAHAFYVSICNGGWWSNEKRVERLIVGSNKSEIFKISFWKWRLGPNDEDIREEEIWIEIETSQRVVVRATISRDDWDEMIAWWELENQS